MWKGEELVDIGDTVSVFMQVRAPVDESGNRSHEFRQGFEVGQIVDFTGKSIVVRIDSTHAVGLVYAYEGAVRQINSGVVPRRV